MSNRTSPLPVEQQLELGHQIAMARDAGVAWKVLEQVYNRHRVQLWRYQRSAEANATK